MTVQGIGAVSAGLTAMVGVKPHSDGLEPPSPAKMSPATAGGAQQNAAAGSVEAATPRRDSQSGLDVYA